MKALWEIEIERINEELQLIQEADEDILINTYNTDDRDYIRGLLEDEKQYLTSCIEDYEDEDQDYRKIGLDPAFTDWGQVNGQFL